MKSDALSVPEELSTHPTKRQLNPWLLVFGAGFGFMVLVVVGLSLLALLAPKHSLRANEVVMPDGKVLRIEGITWGKTHRLDYEYSPSGSWEFWNRRTNPITHGVGQDQLMVWMTCHDAQSGRSLDFDWWSGSVVPDPLGQEINDANSLFWQFGARGSSGNSGGERPFRADRTSYDNWIVGSCFPAFRTEKGRFKLQVKNVSGEIVATFELTHPSPPPVQTWQAEELPATKSVGDVSVTLKRLHPNFNWHTSNGVARKYWYFSPEATVSENGQPSNDWYASLLDLSDPLGNPLHYSGQLSSMREPVWKVRLVATRIQTSKFTAAETWKPADLPLPAKDTAVPLTDSQTIDGVTVTLIALAGVGKTSYSIATPGIRKYGTNFSLNTSGSAFGSTTKFDLKASGSTVAQTVEANWPHLSLEATELTPLHRVYVLAKDEKNRDVPTHQDFNAYGVQSVYFKTEPDAKSLTLLIIIHKGHEFEFFIKPPELPEDKPMP